MESSSLNAFWNRWFFADHPWVVEVILALLVLFLLNVALKKMIRRSKKLAHLKQSEWGHHLDYVAIAPARMLLWILLGSFLLDLVIRELNLSGLSFVCALRNAGVIVCLAWFLLRWKKVFHRLVSSRPKNEKGPLSLDPFTLEIVGKLFTIAVLFLASLTIMQLFGLNVVPLITFGGIGAFTLGIAGKDVISNFFGGMMLYFTRPFKIHDLIELPQRKTIGYIEEIGWYFTSLRDMEKKPIYIPNAVFSTELVINQSRMTHRRIDELIGVRYDDLGLILKILEEIRASLGAAVSIDHHQPIYVFLKHLGDISIQIEIKAYVIPTRYDEFMVVRQAILMDVCKIIEKHGAVMPYPTMEIIHRK